MNLPPRRGLALTIIGPILMLVFAPAALGIGIWRGVAVAQNQLDSYSWVEAGGSSYLEVAYFDPDGPGAYRVDCPAAQVKVMPTQALNQADDAFGSRFVVGLGAAGIVFVIGVILLIVGIVKLVGSSRERQSALIARMGYGPTYGSAYGAPPATYGSAYGAPPAPYQGSYPPQPPPIGDLDDPYARP